MLAIRNQSLIQSFNSISTRNLSTAANLSRATLSSNLKIFSRSLHSTRRSKMSTPPTLNFKDTQISLVQLGQTSKDKSFNLSHAKHFINKASSQSPKPDLIVLPECFNSPYGVDHFADYAEDLQGLWEKVKDPLPNNTSEYQPFESDPTSTVRGNFTIDGKDGRSIDVQKEGFQSETLNMLSQSARENQVVLIGGSIPEKDKDGKLYNTSLVFNQQGHVISMFRKVHLFDIDIPGKMTFQESLTLTGGDRVTVFECSQGLFGLAICYDLRFPEPAQIAARMGAGAMIYPGAFNTTTGPRHWELLQRSRATDNQLYVCACSPARPSEKEIQEKKSYPSWGHSTVVNPWSEVVATTDEKEGIVNWKLEKSQIEEVRKMIPIGTQRRWDVYRDVGRV